MVKFIFDLDGTITSAETLPIIAKNFHVHEEMTQLTKDTVDGKIPWKHSFIRRVGLLRHVPVSDIAKLLEKTPLYPKIVRFIKENNENCYIATGNLDCWVDGLCNKIGCQFFSSKATVINNEISEISHILEKADVVEFFKKQDNIVVFIGDSNNDVNAMRKADISIAYGASHTPSKFCLSAADYVVYSESELMSLISNIIVKYPLS